MYTTFEGRRKDTTLYRHEDHEYRGTKRIGLSRYLSCTDADCRGRAVIRDGVCRVTNPHSHGPLPDNHFKIQEGTVNKLIECKLNDLSLLTNGEEIARRRSVLQINNERRLAVLGEQLTGQQIAPLAFVKRACAFIRRYAEDHVETSESQTDEDGNADGPREGNPDREPETDEENVNHQDDQDDTTDRSSSPTRAPDNSCPVCLLNPRNAVFVPCGHALCYDCGVHVQGNVAPNNRQAV